MYRTEPAHGGSYAGHVQHAVATLEAADWPAARCDLDALRERSGPDNERLLADLLRWLEALQAGRLEEAFRILCLETWHLSLFGASPIVRAAFGCTARELEQAGQLELALWAFDEAVELREVERLRERLGLEGHQASRLGAEILAPHYEEQLAERANDVVVLTALAAIRLAAYLPEDAEPYVRLARERDPAYWPATLTLAALLVRLSRPGDAAALFEQRARAEPDRTAPLIALAEMRWHQLGRRDAAIEALWEAVQRYSGEDGPWGELALRLQLLGKHDKLAQLYEHLLRQASPASPFAAQLREEQARLREPLDPERAGLLADLREIEGLTASGGSRRRRLIALALVGLLAALIVALWLVRS